MKKTLLACALFGMVLFASGMAAAAQGYVCTVKRHPGSSIWGSAGHVVVKYNTLPGCGGTVQANRYYCSPTPTSTACASNAGYHYTRDDLNALASMLHNAAIANTKVQHDDATCVGGTQETCGSIVYFYSEP